MSGARLNLWRSECLRRRAIAVVTEDRCHRFAQAIREHSRRQPLPPPLFELVDLTRFGIRVQTFPCMLREPGP